MFRTALFWKVLGLFHTKLNPDAEIKWSGAYVQEQILDNIQLWAHIKVQFRLLLLNSGRWSGGATVGLVLKYLCENQKPLSA